MQIFLLSRRGRTSIRPGMYCRKRRCARIVQISTPRRAAGIDRVQRIRSGVFTMVLIHVPRPKDAYNPDRPVGSLLKTQVEHLREAESKLPLRYRRRIDTYIKAIKTEGEAAAYIRTVTEAIHAAHTDA